MRKISAHTIIDVVAKLCIKANTELRPDILGVLKRSFRCEPAGRAKRVLGVLIQNAAIAKREGIALCQDTGIACVYLEIGQDVRITGGSLEKAVNDGVRIGYRRGYFRNSVVDPISRKNTGTNTPAIIHTRLVKGDKVRITVVPKGFGCENKNALRLFHPTADLEDIRQFIVDVVAQAGPDACPPYIVGVGIGGTFEKAAALSKEALLKTVASPSTVLGMVRGVVSSSNHRQSPVAGPVSRLEKELLKEINKLNIGPQGLGGKTTALAVHVLTYPTHIAGLPVAVSIGCHAMRSATRVI